MIRSLSQPRSRLRSALTWYLLGLATVAGGWWLIDHTPYVDRLVRPLLLSDTARTGEAIVVLSAGVNDACTPNHYSLRRTLLGARLYREGRAPLILLTGGTPDGVSCSVASVMAKLMVEIGVPESAILTETQSRTTWQNAEFSAPLLKAVGARRVILVTDRLHMARAERSFARFGFQVERASVPLYETAGSNVVILYWGLREMAAISVYRWRGLIGDGTPPAAADAVRETEIARTMEISHPNGPIVILGASYARGWRVSSIAGVPVVNVGVGGEQSFEMLGRFDRDVLPHAPRAVIIWGFINDIFRSPREGVEQALGRARTSFERIVVKAREHGIEPILATEVTVRPPNTMYSNVASLVGGWLGRRSYQDYVNSHVLDMNGWLRQFAAREGLLLLDIQPALSEASGSRRREYADKAGSHISPAGYEALTRYTEPILQPRLAKR